MARRRQKQKFDLDVIGFLSIMSIVTGLICLILFVIALRIAMNPEALKIVKLAGLYTGKGNVENPKVPSYIDCGPDRLVLYPGEIQVRWEDIQRPGNALELMLDGVQNNAAKEYVVVMVRPGSVKFYRALRNVLGKRPIDVGYDAVDTNFNVDWDEAVKALKIVE